MAESKDDIIKKIYYTHFGSIKGTLKEAEPQKKSAHPGKASGTKSASSYGPAREGRGVGDNSNTSKPYWEGRPAQKIKDRLNQLGHVISADKLRGPNKLTKADLLQMLYKLDKNIKQSCY